jgi:oxalate decarboxylase/phosphoglucose isomerase-like protein (cupin superfamily)
MRFIADGFVLGPGEGERVSPTMTLKVGDENSTAWSMFEVVNIGPGFDVGAHLHRNAEELFYVLEGQLDLLAFEPRVRTPGSWQGWQSHTGAAVARGGPGSMMYVPRGCPHAFANPGPGPARMVFLVSPPVTSITRSSSPSWSPARLARWRRRSPSCAPAMTSSSSPRPHSAGHKHARAAR